MYNKCVHCQIIYNLFVRSLETGRCQMYKTTAKMSEKSSNQRRGISSVMSALILLRFLSIALRKLVP